MAPKYAFGNFVGIDPEVFTAGIGNGLDIAPNLPTSFKKLSHSLCSLSGGSEAFVRGQRAKVTKRLKLVLTAVRIVYPCDPGSCASGLRWTEPEETPSAQALPVWFAPCLQLAPFTNPAEIQRHRSVSRLVST